MAYGLQVTFDAADPDRLAHFWADALGYVVQPPPKGHESWPDFLASIGVPESEWDKASAIVDPDGKGPRVFFQRVPEGKSAKNRVHLDVSVGADLEGDERRATVEREVARLVDLGATELGPKEQHGEVWVVLQDPEGNEVCVA